MCFESCIIIANTWNFQFQTERCFLYALMLELSDKLRVHRLSLMLLHSPCLWTWLVCFLMDFLGCQRSSRTLSCTTKHNWLNLWGQGCPSLMDIKDHLLQIDGSSLLRVFSAPSRCQLNTMFLLLFIDYLVLLSPSRRPWFIVTIPKAWTGGHLRICSGNPILIPTIVDRLPMTSNFFVSRWHDGY